MTDAATTPPSAGDLPDRLRARVLAGAVPAVLVLPSLVRGGQSYYGELDLEAVKLARAAGHDADFLDAPADRPFLSEFSSGLLLTFAMAVAQDATLEIVKDAAGHVLASLRNAVSRGHIAEAAEVRIRIKADRWRRDGDRLDVKGLEVEGTGEEAVLALIRGLAGDDAMAVAVADALELPPGGG